MLRGRAMLAPTEGTGAQGAGRMGDMADVRRGESPLGVMRHYGRLRIRRGAVCEVRLCCADERCSPLQRGRGRRALDGWGKAGRYGRLVQRQHAGSTTGERRIVTAGLPPSARPNGRRDIVPPFVDGTSQERRGRLRERPRSLPSDPGPVKLRRAQGTSKHRELQAQGTVLGAEPSPVQAPVQTTAGKDRPARMGSRAVIYASRQAQEPRRAPKGGSPYLLFLYVDGLWQELCRGTGTVALGSCAATIRSPAGKARRGDANRKERTP